jgi:hypothetical protein
VPAYVDLVMLSDDEVASLPTLPNNNTQCTTPRSALLNATASLATADLMPPLGLKRLSTRGTSNITDSRGGGTMTQRQATNRVHGNRRGAARRTNDPPSVDTFVVPRLVAAEIAALRNHSSWAPSQPQLASTAGRSASLTHRGSTANGQLNMMSSIGVTGATPLLVSGKLPFASFDNVGGDLVSSPHSSMSPTSPSSAWRVQPPPKVLPTVNITQGGRDWASGHKSLGLGSDMGSQMTVLKTDRDLQREALAWYRTEVAMLRERE